MNSKNDSDFTGVDYTKDFFSKLPITVAIYFSSFRHSFKSNEHLISD